jgi:hypothetical protein
MRERYLCFEAFCRTLFWNYYVVLAIRVAGRKNGEERAIVSVSLADWVAFRSMCSGHKWTCFWKLTWNGLKLRQLNLKTTKCELGIDFSLDWNSIFPTNLFVVVCNVAVIFERFWQFIGNLEMSSPDCRSLLVSWLAFTRGCMHAWGQYFRALYTCMACFGPRVRLSLDHRFTALVLFFGMRAFVSLRFTALALLCGMRAISSSNVQRFCFFV